MTEPMDLGFLWRESLAAFTHRAFLELRPGETFLPNYHHHAMAEGYQQVEKGAIKKLVVNIAPRTLKSLMASVAFPAWVLGRRRHRKIMCISYGQGLAHKHANDTRQLMMSPFYRQTFGDVLLPSRQSKERLITVENGFREAYSVTGDLRGSGADIIDIDDPLKGIEMQSTAERDRTNSAFDSVITSRLNNQNEGSIIIVMQRIHLDDLVGHVLKGTGWEVISIPAISTAPMVYSLGNGHFYRRKVGEVIQPERQSFAQLMEMKQQMGTYIFEAQCQQNPIPAQGNLFQLAWFKYYDFLPMKFDRVIQSWDTGMQLGDTNDFSVCTTWGVLGSDLYLLDVIRERLEYPDLRRRILSVADQFKPFAVVIEAAGAGISVIQDLRKETEHRLLAFKPKQDKQHRAYAASATAEAGQILLPRSAQWLDAFLAELIAFPGGTHDDQVDSVSQFVRWNLRFKRLGTERPDPPRPSGLPVRARPQGARRTRPT
jgi:predicted phage terminase large subunit-like protein